MFLSVLRLVSALYTCFNITTSFDQALTILVLFYLTQNVGVHYEKWNTGVLGPVSLKGLNEGTRDLTKQKWSYKVRASSFNFSVKRI